MSPFVVWMRSTSPASSAAGAGQGVGDDPGLELVEVRIGLVPVVGVLRRVERLARLVVLEDERTGADGLRLECRVLVSRREPRRARDHARLSGEVEGEDDPGSLHRDGHRHRIGEDDLRRAVRVRRDVTEDLAGQERRDLPLHVVDHRRAIERRAVVELDARSSVEGPDRVVRVRGDLVSEVRHELAVFGDRRERVVHAADRHVARRRAEHLGRLPRAAGVGLDADDELAARHRRLGRRCSCCGRAARRGCRRPAA